MSVQTEADRGPSVSLFPTVFTFCSPNHATGLINSVMMQKPVNFMCLTWNPFLTLMHRAECNVPSDERWFTRISCSDKVTHVRTYYNPV